jgi:hypothetical protein
MYNPASSLTHTFPSVARVTTSTASNQTILAGGCGIGGMTAALEAAECGKQVILVERNAMLGGSTALLYRYFPKMCHLSCGLEINKKNGTKLAMPVVYYSQLMTVTYGGSLKDAGLDGQVIPATGLEKIVNRK